MAITAKELYAAYPGPDLLGIEPPTETTTLDDLAKQAAESGDLLFQAIVDECVDNDGDAEDVFDALAYMIDDISSVRRKLQEKRFGDE